MTKKDWTGKTYGNDWMHNTLVRLLRHIPLWVMYWFVSVFVMPVTFVVNRRHRHVYRYYHKHLGFSPLMSVIRSYVNFCNFSKLVIDRFAFYSGRKFKIEVEGQEFFDKLASRPEGFMMMSAHLGNFEIAGYSLVSDKKRFNVLAFAGEKGSVMENRGKVFERTNINMIGIGQGMDYVFEISAALNRGEILAAAADRVLGSSKSVEAKILDANASLPAGPFSIAVAQRLDVILVLVLKQSYSKYKIYVTPLEYDKTARRAVAQNQLVQNYAQQLSRRIRQYPDHWFNYYDFWND